MQFFNWNVIQAATFYVVWFLIVSRVSSPGGEIAAISYQIGFVALCLIVSFKKGGQGTFSAEAKFILTLMLLGWGLDGTLAFLQIFQFPFTDHYLGAYPIWMLGMWACFATAFSTSLKWILNKPSIQILFGAIGGPLSLYAATQMGAVAFPFGPRVTLPLIAVEWSLVMLIASKLFIACSRSTEIVVN